MKKFELGRYANEKSYRPARPFTIVKNWNSYPEKTIRILISFDNFGNRYS